jgi:AcrR family transcriptional regulator
MTDGRTLRWAGHRDQRRAEFVDSALLVIARDGPGATVDAISAERGVSRQALYRQFDDRSDLDRAIAQRAADDLMSALLPRLDLSGDVEQSVRTALVVYLDHITGQLALYRFVRAHEADPGDDTVRRVKDTVAGRVAGVASAYLLEKGLASVEVAPTFALGVVGMADAVISAWLDDPRGLSRDDLVDQLTVMIVGVVRTVTG